MTAAAELELARKGAFKATRLFMYPWTTAPDDARGYVSILDGKRRRLSVCGVEPQCDQTEAKSNVKNITNPRIAAMISGRMYEVGSSVKGAFALLDEFAGDRGETRVKVGAAKKYGIAHNGSLLYPGRKQSSVEIVQDLLCTSHYMTPAWRQQTHAREAYSDVFNALYMRRKNKRDDVCDALLLALEYAVRQYKARVMAIAREQLGRKRLLTRKRHEWWPPAARALHEQGATMRVLGIDVGTVNFGACHLELYHAYYAPRSPSVTSALPADAAASEKGEQEEEETADEDENDEALLRPVFRILQWALFDLTDTALHDLPGEATDIPAALYERQIVYCAPPEANPIPFASAFAATMEAEENRMRQLLGRPLLPSEPPVAITKRPRRKPAPKRKRDDDNDGDAPPPAKRARKAPAAPAAPAKKRARASSDADKAPRKRARKTPPAAPVAIDLTAADEDEREVAVYRERYQQFLVQAAWPLARCEDLVQRLAPSPPPDIPYFVTVSDADAILPADAPSADKIAFWLRMYDEAVSANAKVIALLRQLEDEAAAARRIQPTLPPPAAATGALVYPPPPTEPEPSVDTTELNDPRLCLVCFDRAYVTVAVPCGHRLGCLTCMSQSNIKACMLCTAPLTQILRVRE